MKTEFINTLLIALTALFSFSSRGTINMYGDTGRHPIIYLIDEQL